MRLCSSLLMTLALLVSGCSATICRDSNGKVIAGSVNGSCPKEPKPPTNPEKIASKMDIWISLESSPASSALKVKWEKGIRDLVTFLSFSKIDYRIGFFSSTNSEGESPSGRKIGSLIDSRVTSFVSVLDQNITQWKGLPEGVNSRPARTIERAMLLPENIDLKRGDSVKWVILFATTDEPDGATEIIKYLDWSAGQHVNMVSVLPIGGETPCAEFSALPHLSQAARNGVLSACGQPLGENLSKILKVGGPTYDE